jgi:nucleotide-binding universal stress UspA family protein
VPSAVPARGALDAPGLERAERRLRDLKSYQAEMADKLRRLDIPAVPGTVERVLEEGDPAAVILRKAVETCCDLIVMGTHGRTGELPRLMGSVAEAVTRKACCPVLTVKTPSLEPVEEASLEEMGAAL